MVLISYFRRHYNAGAIFIVFCSVFAGVGVFILCDTIGTGSSAALRTFAVIPAAAMLVFIYGLLYRAIGGKGYG